MKNSIHDELFAVRERLLVDAGNAFNALAGRLQSEKQPAPRLHEAAQAPARDTRLSPSREGYDRLGLRGLLRVQDPHESQ